MTVKALGGGRYEVTTESGRVLAYGVRRGGETWVFLRGSVYVFEANAGDGARAVRGAHQDLAALAAPMPATVVAINVTPGQAVAAGDVLLVLEAMKMELAITAPRDGRVRSIACRVGELVQPGVPLIDLE